ncbi:MAG: hypothetical protein LAT78_04950 [Roseinatronobacter sp.]|nr:hypothetical protein [Roseinatronobacter sp.]
MVWPVVTCAPATGHVIMARGFGFGLSALSRSATWQRMARNRDAGWRDDPRRAAYLLQAIAVREG